METQKSTIWSRCNVNRDWSDWECSSSSDPSSFSMKFEISSFSFFIFLDDGLWWPRSMISSKYSMFWSDRLYTDSVSLILCGEFMISDSSPCKWAHCDWYTLSVWIRIKRNRLWDTERRSDLLMCFRLDSVEMKESYDSIMNAVWIHLQCVRTWERSENEIENGLVSKQHIGSGKGIDKIPERVHWQCERDTIVPRMRVHESAFVSCTGSTG